MPNILNLCDRNPIKVDVKYSNMKIRPEFIIINSNKTFKELCKGI